MLAEGDRVYLRAAAADLGITRQALRGFLTRQGLLRRCSRVAGRLFVGIDELELYERSTNLNRAERRALRQRGWLGGKQAAEFVGCSPSTLYRLARRSGLAASWVRCALFYDRSELERLRQEFSSSRALPGWLEVRAFAARHGVYGSTLLRWLRRRGLEVRLQRRASDNQWVAYALAGALQGWAAGRLGDAIKDQVAIGAAVPAPLHQAGLRGLPVPGKAPAHPQRPPRRHGRGGGVPGLAAPLPRRQLGAAPPEPGAGP
jgi:hypothetical protein